MPKDNPSVGRTSFRCSALKTLILQLFHVGRFAIAIMLLAASLLGAQFGLSHARVLAQTPNTTVNYQARILTSTGAVVPDGNYHIEFKIYDDISAGTTAQGTCTGNCLWVETRSTGNLVRVVNGYVSVNLGSVTSFPSSMPWSQNLYVTMRVGGNSGSASWDTEMTNSGNRMKLNGAPLAYVANNLASSNTNAASTNSSNISIQTGNALGTTSNSGSISIDSGTATGTTGTITLGATNASGITIGRSGLNTSVAGTLSVATLGSADTSSFVCRNTSNLLASCTFSPLSSSLTDNVTDAFDLQEGTNNYININTTNSSENISFGNTTTNPSYSFLGSGTLTVSGATTVNGLITGTAGLTVSGAAVSINDSSNFNTTINTGSSTGSVTIGNNTGNTGLTFDSGTGTIAIGTGAQARTLNIGTGAAAQTVNLGSLSGASITTISAGTGTATGDLNLLTSAGGIINIGNNTVSNKILNLGSTGSTNAASTVNIASSNANQTQSVTIGNTGSANNSVLIEGGTSSTAIRLSAGTNGTISLGATNNNNLNLNTAAIAGTTIIGGTSTTGTITVGRSTANNTISIGDSAGNGNTQTITIGTSSTGGSTTNVTIGSTVAGTVTLQGNVAVPNLSATTGTTFVCRNASNYLSTCTNAPLISSLTDNITDSFDLQEGTNNYININTTDSSENISFGNATTNPSYNFLGSGVLSVAGAQTIAGNLTVDTSTFFVNATSDFASVGSTSDLGGRFQVVGANDETQLLIRANGTQSMSNPLVLLQNSSGSELARINATTSSLFFGNAAGGSSAAGVNNTGIGASALGSVSTGTGNTTLGSGALASVFVTNNNTALGYNAGNLATGSNNIFIGAQAGDNVTTGSDNIIIGYNLDASSAGVSNELRLGGVLQGNTSTLAAQFNGTLAITTLGSTDNASFLCRNSSNILAGCNYTPLNPTLTDNIADALDIQEGTNNYININTTNGSENISFGNATTNPSYSFLGSGTLTVSGATTSTGLLRAGTGGTNGTATGAGDLYVQDAAEIDGSLTVTSTTANTFNLDGTGTLSVVSDLTSAGRTSSVFSITQANDASNNSSAPLVTFSNSDTASTSAVLSINQQSNGVGIDLSGSAVTSTSIALAAYSTGVGITGGIANTATTGSVLRVNTNGTSVTGNYSGAIIDIAPTRTVSTATTVTESGNYLKLQRTASTTNAGATYAITGDLASFVSNCTQTSGSCTDSSNVLSVTQSYASATGEALMVSNAGTGSSFRVNDDGTETDSTPFVIDSNGNVGVGTVTVNARFEVTGTTGSAVAAIINNGTSTGNILNLQDNGTNVLTVADGGALTAEGLVTLNGGLTVQTGDTFTFNADAFTDFTGGGLINNAGVLSIDTTSSTGYFRNGGNAFTATSSLGNTGNYNLNIITNNTNRITVENDGDVVFGSNILYVDSANSRVALGTNDVTNATFTVAGTAPDVANGAGIRIDSTLTSTTQNQNGVFVRPTVSPASSSTRTYAALNFAAQSSSGNISGASLMGIFGGASFSGTGTLGAGYGAYFQNYNNSSGTISDSYGVYVDSPSNAGTITRNYGLVVVNQTAGGSANANITVGNAPTSGNWSIYSQSAYNSAFNGNVRIGSTVAPTVALDVTGSAIISPTANSAVALTVNGTTGTAATALAVAQGGAATGFSVTANAITTQSAATISSTGVLTTTGNLLALTANSATTSTGVLTVNATGLTSGYAQTINVNSATTLTTGGGLQIVGPTGAANLTSGNGLLRVSSAGAFTTTAGVGGLFQVSSATVTGTVASIISSATMTTTGNLLTLTANSATTATGLLTINGTGLTTGSALNINAGTATAISSGGNIIFKELTGTRTLGVQTRTTAGTAGTSLTISAGSAATTGTYSAGGILTLQGGVASGTTGTSANGGNVVIAGGTGIGSGVSGLVVISNPTYQTATVQNFTASANITQANIDSNGAILISSNAAGYTATLGDPTITTAGRVVYVTNSGTFDMTLAVNGGGTGNTITLKPSTTATMIWNGADWTAAGASSSTDLQAAYNNTATSAGGAELVLNASGGAADGLTIRNNATTPIVGGLLEVQNSVGSNLFTVNNNATEYANNGGAESSTFTMWTTAPTAGGTITRYTTAGDNIATGAASVYVDSTATANTGVRNTLASTLTRNLKYRVSFAVRHTSSSTTFSTLDVRYSPTGTTTDQEDCSTGNTVNYGQWTRVTCNFIYDNATTPNASNAILITHSDASDHNYYIDNLSVTVSADVNHAVDGSVELALGTNWQAIGGSVTRSTTVLYDTSGSVQATTSAVAGRGVYNNLTSGIVPQVSTQYRVAFYARGDGTNTATLAVAYTPDNNSTSVSCTDYSRQVVSATAYELVTCLLTTSATSPVTSQQLRITQTAGSATSFYVDSLTMTLNTNNANNVQIGGANEGGPVTLFTLDRSNGAPIAANNDAYLGSMYYDTATGRIQCYEADGWGACGAAPDNIVNLNPEYAGAVLNGSGVGTMTADFCGNGGGLTTNTSLCATGESRNFYRWTSPQATQQTYSIYVTYQLPTTFNGFSSDDTIQLTGRVDSTTNAAVTYEVFRSTGGAITQCGTGETNVITQPSGAAGVAGTWYSYGINGNEATGCGFTSQAAGNFVIFKINMKANSNANAYVSTLSFVTTGR